MRIWQRARSIVRRCEEGMVTTELAIGMAALLAVLVLLVGALDAVRTQAEVCQAVREGARAAAVGDSGSAAVSRSYPPANGASEAHDGDWVTVSAEAEAALVVTVSCSATALIEPGLP